jgi:hypothetical protein
MEPQVRVGGAVGVCGWVVWRAWPGTIAPKVGPSSDCGWVLAAPNRRSSAYSKAITALTGLLTVKPRLSTTSSSR